MKSWQIIAALLCFRLVLPAQEVPLRITGTFSSGYYSTYTKGEANQTVQFVPFGAKFEIDGYVFSPDFLSFSAQPQLNFGPQASEAGFQGGTGVSLRATVLRKRSFPVTFRYSNIQLEDVYFGSLSQVSAYSLQNRTKDLGVTWELRPEGLPATTIDWGTGSIDSKSDTAIIPDYLSTMNHVNLDSHYQRWGWDLGGFGHRQEQQSDLISPSGAGTSTATLNQTVTQFQGSAGRSLFQDSELYMDGGHQSTSSILYGLPINLNTNFANANLRLFQRRRWKASVRAGYSSNLASQYFSQLFTLAPGAVAPDPSTLGKLDTQISNLNLNATTSVDLAHGFSLYGNADRSSILATSQTAPLNANYFTTSVGVMYSGTILGTRVSGQYAREFGHGSITGQSGTIQGQSYTFNAQHGAPDRIQLEGSVHGSEQTVQNAVPIDSRSFAADGSIAHTIGGSLRARAGGGWQWGDVQNGANQFRSSGFTARIGIEHPRVQVSAAISDSLGSSLPVYADLLTGVGGALLVPLNIIPSDFRAMTFTLHSNPIRKVELSATWTRSLQHLDGVLNNDFELLNIHALYHYRRIQFDGGFIRSQQVFFNSPEMRRGRVYIRVSRTAKIL